MIQVFTAQVVEKARWGPNVEKANQLHKNSGAEKADKNRMNERLRSCKVLQSARS